MVANFQSLGAGDEPDHDEASHRDPRPMQQRVTGSMSSVRTHRMNDEAGSTNQNQNRNQNSNNHARNRHHRHRYGTGAAGELLAAL